MPDKLRACEILQGSRGNGARQIFHSQRGAAGICGARAEGKNEETKNEEKWMAQDAAFLRGGK
jgi:hypothetical protein